MNIVVTSAHEKDAKILKEFLASLRLVANFKDDIIVIAYGRQLEVKKLCEKYGAKIRHATSHELPHKIDAYRKLYQIASKTNPKNNIAFFSNTTWFQNSIDEVFTINADGLFFLQNTLANSIGITGMADSTDEARFMKIQLDIESIHGAPVSPDMIVGNAAAISEKMKSFGDFLNHKLKHPTTHGSEGYILNEIFNKDKDKLSEGRIFSVPAYDAVPTTKAIYIIDETKEAIGIRLDAVSINFANLRFATRYPHLLT